MNYLCSAVQADGVRRIRVSPGHPSRIGTVVQAQSRTLPSTLRLRVRTRKALAEQPRRPWGTPHLSPVWRERESLGESADAARRHPRSKACRAAAAPVGRAQGWIGESMGTVGYRVPRRPAATLCRGRPGPNRAARPCRQARRRRYAAWPAGGGSRRGRWPHGTPPGRGGLPCHGPKLTLPVGGNASGPCGHGTVRSPGGPPVRDRVRAVDWRAPPGTAGSPTRRAARHTRTIQKDDSEHRPLLYHSISTHAAVEAVYSCAHAHSRYSNRLSPTPSQRRARTPGPRAGPPGRRPHRLNLGRDQDGACRAALMGGAGERRRSRSGPGRRVPAAGTMAHWLQAGGL